jgi:hypothetical protein
VRLLKLVRKAILYTYTTSVLPFVRVFGTTTYLASCLEVMYALR